jgi:predicted nucleotidyltransferase
MLLTQGQKKQIVTLLHDKIPNLQALYLFGSQSDKSAGRGSDVDIAYLSQDSLSALERWEISQKLASRLLKDVDLIDLKETNTIFRFQIVSTGERMYGGGYEMEMFEMLAYSFYLRFQEERRSIVDAIKRDGSVLGEAYA